MLATPPQVPQPAFPPGHQRFAALDLCPFEAVKAVIVGQDPYHGDGQANGLAFSVNDGVAIPPSLRNIFREVADDTGAELPESGNLERWARQGVLLLNSVLSVAPHAPGSHASFGWQRLTDSIITALSAQRQGLVFMLWGNYAAQKAGLIDSGRHLVLTAPHPSPLSARRGFFGCKHFSKANEYLIDQGIAPIVW